MPDGTRSALGDLEELAESQLNQISARYEQLATEAREDLSGLVDTGRPAVDVTSH